MNQVKANRQVENFEIHSKRNSPKANYPRFRLLDLPVDVGRCRGLGPAEKPPGTAAAVPPAADAEGRVRPVSAGRPNISVKSANGSALLEVVVEVETAGGGVKLVQEADVNSGLAAGPAAKFVALALELM